MIAAVAWWLFADTVRHHGIGRGALRISYWGDYVPYLMWQEAPTLRCIAIRAGDDLSL